MPIRIVLADDEALTRGAVARLLDLEEDLEVVAEAGNAPDAVDAVLTHSPDVAVLDLDMPGQGLTAVERLAGAAPGTRCVMLTRHARPGVLRRSLELGIAGFVPKTSSGAELAEIIRRVATGGRYIDPDVAYEALVGQECPLTARELDVLSHVSPGSTTRDLARTLHLSAGTVRNYLSSCMTKLGTSTRQEAFDAAREAGWV